MATIIICFIIGLIIDRKDNIFYGVTTAISLAIGMGLYVLGGLIFYNIFPTQEILKEEKEIFAIADSISTEGQSFLLSGNINEEIVYRYVTETEKGKIVEEVRDTDADVYIIETDDEKAYMKRYERESKNKWQDWFFAYEYKDVVEFHIPKNSIVSEFNIDLQ